MGDVMRRVVVTGLGLVTPLGCGVDVACRGHAGGGEAAEVAGVAAVLDLAV